MAGQPKTEGKTLVELLDMLEPIPEPEPISMFPATAGWIWLGLALAGLLIWSGMRVRRHWRANAYRRAALTELAAAGDDPAIIAVILRRAALAAYPRADVAHLTGSDWLAFLDEQCPGVAFASATGESLTRAPFRSEPPNPDATRIAANWLRHHRRAAR